MIQNTALISVRKNKLFMSLLIMSANEWEADTRTRRYHVTLAMPNGLTDRHTLQMRVHDEYKSQGEPAKSRVLDRLVTLRLDTVQQVFYSALEPTARMLPVFRDDIKNPFELGDLSDLHLVEPYIIPYFPVVPQYVAGTFPVIRLLGQMYYFIKGEWYAGAEKAEIDELDWFTKDAFRYVPNRNRKMPY